MKTVTFNEYACVVSFPKYVNGGRAIQLYGAESSDYAGEPIATASTWIAGLAPDEVAIKNYSENEGMLDALLTAGIVSAPHRFLNGFPIVRVIE